MHKLHSGHVSIAGASAAAKAPNRAAPSPASAKLHGAINTSLVSIRIVHAALTVWSKYCRPIRRSAVCCLVMNAYDLSEVEILIVEDYWVMRTLLSAILTGLGAPSPRTAKSGQEALTEIAVKVPDLIITDWEMSPINGIELVRHLRDESVSSCPTIPVIMLTAHCDRGKLVEACDAGINEFLAKPFTVNAIYQRIVRVIEHPQQLIRTVDHFEPDRRRNAEGTSGEERRQVDPDLVLIGDESTDESRVDPD